MLALIFALIFPFRMRFANLSSKSLQCICVVSVHNGAIVEDGINAVLIIPGLHIEFLCHEGYLYDTEGTAILTQASIMNHGIQRGYMCGQDRINPKPGLHDFQK